VTRFLSINPRLTHGDAIISKALDPRQQVAVASDGDLRALPSVQQAFAATEQQLQVYIPRLQNKYGTAMKLRTFAVVAVEFERIRNYSAPYPELLRSPMICSRTRKKRAVYYCT